MIKFFLMLSLNLAAYGIREIQGVTYSDANSSIVLGSLVECIESHQFIEPTFTHFYILV